MNGCASNRPPPHPGQSGGALVRLVSALALLIVLLIGIVALNLWLRERERMTDSVTEQALTLTRAIAATGNQAIQRNLYLLQETISQRLAHPDLLEVDIVDADDFIVASRQPARIGRTLTDPEWQTLRKSSQEAVAQTRTLEGVPALVVATPLFEHDEIQAWVRVVYSLARLQEARRREIATVASLLAITVAIGMGGLWLAMRYATGVLKQVLDPIEQAVAVSAGGTTAGGTTAGDFERLTLAATAAARLVLHQATQLRQAHDTLEARVRERTAALDESQARLQLSLDASNAGTWSWDVATNASQWDESYHALYGFGPDDPVSFNTWIERVHPEDRARLQRRIAALIESATSDAWNEEFRVDHPTKGTRWMHGFGRVERDSDGRAIRFAGLNIDATERKQAEEDLRKTHALLDAIVENLPNMIFLKDARDLRFALLNRAGEDLLGFAREDLLGKNDCDFFPVSQADFFMARDRDVLNNHAALDILEEPIQTRAKGLRILHTKKVPLFDGDGRPQYLLGISEDITDRKRAEEGLALFRTLLDQVTDAIEVIDPDTGRFLDANVHAWTSLGYTRAELLALTVPDIDPSVAKPVFDAYVQRLRDSGIAPRIESVHRHRDGAAFPVEVSLQLVRGDQEYLVAVVRDISVRKHVETQLREREEQYRNIFEAIADPVLVAGFNGFIRDANPAACREYGYDREELIGRRLETLLHESSQPELIEGLAHVHAGRSSMGECLHVRQDGSTFTGEVRNIPFRIMGESVVLQVSRNITARKETEAQLQNLLEAAPDATVTVDQTGRISRVNHQMEQLLDYRAEELLGQSIEALIPERFHEGHRGYRADFMAMPRLRLMGEGRELFAKRKDGTEVPVEISLSPLETADGPLVIAAVRDISARKRAEAAQQRLAAIVESSDDAIISKTLDGVVTSWNGGAERLLGYGANEMIGQPITRIFPLKRVKEEENILRRIRRGEAIDHFETVRVRKDGSLIDLSLTLSPLKNAQGAIVGVSKIARDITARRNMERVMSEHVTRLRDLNRELTQAEERERRRIARELHDEFGQALTGLNFDLSALIRRISQLKDSTERGALHDKAESMAPTIDRLIQTVRSTAMALRPPVLDDLGLAAGLEWLADWFHDRSGLRCALAIDPAVREATFSFELSTALFRAAQELLTNVMRHAGASAASVELSGQNRHLRLTVQDNGRGLHEDALRKRASLGLRGLRERVELLGGTMVVVGSPGAGTTVSLTIPLENAGMESEKEGT